MTITAQNVVSGPYFPNGSTVAFPFDFQVTRATDVAVTIDGVAVAMNLFSVSLNGNGSGQVTFFTAPAGGKLYVMSNPAFDETTDFQNQGPFYQDALNDPLYRSAVRDLWLRDRVRRSLRVPMGEMPAVLPDATARAGKALGFGSDGSPIMIDPLNPASASLSLIGYDVGTAYPANSAGAMLGRVVNVDDYGALGNYDPIPDIGADDTAAFIAARNVLPSGGVIRLNPAKRYLIASGLDLGHSVVIDGIVQRSVMDPDQTVCARAGNLYVDPAVSIRIGSRSGFKNLNLFRSGMRFGITGAQVVAQFQGTAVVTKDNSFDHLLDDVAIGGFLNGLVPEFVTGGSEHQCNRTRMTGKVLFDCWNDIRIHNAYDVPVLDGYHGWPFVTYASVPEANGTQLKRGCGVWLSGVNDWTKASAGFNYGRFIGYRMTDCANVVLTTCGADYPYQAAPDGSIGFLIDGASQEIELICPQAAQHDAGVFVNSTVADRLTVTILGGQFWENRRNGVVVNQGSASIHGGFVRSFYIDGSGNGCNGVQAATTAGRIRVSGMHFEGLPGGTALANATDVDMKHDDMCTFHLSPNASIQFAPYRARLIAASTLPLDGSNLSFQIIGNAVINCALNALPYEGKIISLVFVDGNGTVKDNGPVVAGATQFKISGDFNYTPGSTLTCVVSGQQFLEIARNSPGL